MLARYRYRYQGIQPDHVLAGCYAAVSHCQILKESDAKDLSNTQPIG